MPSLAALLAACADFVACHSAGVFDAMQSSSGFHAMHAGASTFYVSINQRSCCCTLYASLSPPCRVPRPKPCSNALPQEAGTRQQGALPAVRLRGRRCVRRARSWRRHRLLGAHASYLSDSRAIWTLLMCLAWRNSSPCHIPVKSFQKFHVMYIHQHGALLCSRWISTLLQHTV